MSLEEMVEKAKAEMKRAEEDNDGLLILETADICIDKLWAEIECLRARLAMAKAVIRQIQKACDD